MAILWALFLPGELSGGNPPCRSDRLERMYAAIGCATSWQGLPIKIEEKDGIVEHIGYRFFSPEEIQALGREVSRFLERYVLEADLPVEREKNIDIQLLEDGILFREGGSLATLKNLCREEHGDVTLQSVSARRYLFRWSGGEVIFPADAELLLGRGQVENGRRLPQEILSSAFEGESTRPAREDLTKREDGLWVLPGNSYYISSLSSDTYYDEDGKAVNNLLNEGETLCNLFSGLIRNSAIRMGIRMNVYSLKLESFETPLTCMAAYALGNNCKAYTGVIARNKKEVELLVVYRNEVAAYNHVLRIQIPHEAIKEGKGTAQARLTPFVPTHSIQYLFEELQQ